MKNVFKLIIKILFSVVIVTILTLIIFFILIYNSKDVTNYEVVCKETPAQVIFNNSLYEGTYDVKNTKEAEVLFSEEELESLIYPIIMSLNQDQLFFEITGVDIDVKKGKYYFEASVTLSDYMKSVVSAELKILNEGNSFVIYLKNLKLGAISITKIGSYLVKNINISELQKTLESKKIYVDVNLEKLKISCTYDNINRMIQENVPEKQSNLIRLLFNVFLTNKEFMDLSFGNNDLLGAYVHLGTAEYNESEDGDLTLLYDFDSVANLVSNLLNNNVITFKDVNVVFNYFVRGYDSLEEEQQKQINDIDLSSIIENKLSYKGIINKPEIGLMDYMLEIFKDKNAFELLNILTNGITISDDFLSSLLQSFDYMGYSFAFSNEDNKVGYFVLEQLNFVCQDQFVDIHLIMNLNGLNLYLEASFDCLDENSNGLQINGLIHDLNIGEYKLNNEQKQLLIAYLSELLVDLEWISIDENSQEITLDFSKALISVISNNSLLNSIIGDSLNSLTKTYIEDGEVSIKFEKLILG